MSGPIQVDASNALAAARAVKNGELPAPAKSLAEAVCRVMSRVSYVQKDKQMTGGGSYRYVSVEAVIDALRPEMIKEQLVLLPSGIETMHQGDHGRQLHVRVKYTFDLLHAPSGQSHPVVVVGEGMDVGDKSGNKCMTAARKYAMIMAFNIETGLDPDDTPSHEQERAPAQPAAKDNPQRRAFFSQKLAQCKSRDEFTQVCEMLKSDVRQGVVSDADRLALRDIAGEVAAKFPPAKA